MVVALSAHGFGHIGQTAPVIHALKQRFPDLAVTVRTSAPRFKLVERLGPGVTFDRVETDVGMRQADAIDVMVEDSAEAYADFHRDWKRKVEDEARALEARGADLVLSNIPYLVLAGARHAGIPAIAICSLNWADIYCYFFAGRRPEAAVIHQQMLSAYGAAQVFLKPAPSMPMPDLANGQVIGPVAQFGQDRRFEIFERLGLNDHERLVLVSVGGMELRVSLDDWPRMPGIRLLVPESWRPSHPDAVALESLDLPFADLMFSCDALIAKPGYGSFVEAACAGVPVLYVDRPNWPEAPFLIAWLQEHGRCVRLDRASLVRGDLEEKLWDLWSAKPPPLVVPSGVEEAVGWIAHYLS